MLTYTYTDKGKFELIENSKPVISDSKDEITWNNRNVIGHIEEFTYQISVFYW